MTAPILTTKLSFPSSDKYLVDRPSLITKLNECLNSDCRLTLISAPAGFGKTTLVSTWVAALKSSERQSHCSVAWLLLDSGDNDPAVFWSYIISSLQTQLEGIGKKSLYLLQKSQAAELEVKLGALVNDLNQIPNPFVLVLDDYHLVRNPAIHRSITFLLEHMPSQFHLIMASRTDPPLPLSLLRGRGQLLEIRMNDLRFSAEEADSFLNSGLGLNLPAHAVAALNQKTEGWIAGLQMAALSLHEVASTGDRERIESFISSFSGTDRFIFDYLIDEVLNQQPVEIQNFLLKTSILDRLCSPLCNSLLADTEEGISPESQDVLEYLENCNLFVVPLDNQRYWYRYHYLFAELLKKRLHQQDPSSVPELHQRAITWYEHNGLPAKAVEHAFLSGDVQKAALFISQICEELWGRGEYTTLLNWIEALPEEEKRKHPHLWIWQVSMLITAGEMHEAERHVAKIEDYLRTLPADLAQTSLVGQIFGLKTYIASFHGDIPNLLHYARLALDSLPEDGSVFDRCGTFLVLSNAYLNKGDLVAASHALTEVINTGKTAHRPYMVLTAMANLAYVLYTQGQLKHAFQICQEAFLLIQHYGLDRSPVAANLFAVQGLIRCERHELDQAERDILWALEIGQQRNYIWSQAWSYRALIRLLLSRNNLPAAEKAIDEAEQLAGLREFPEYLTCGISGLKARLWIRLGKIIQAEEYLHARKIQLESDIFYPHETEYWALASLYLAKEDLESGENLLERMVIWAEGGNQYLWSIRCRVLQSLLYRAMGKQPQSMQFLTKALEMAELEGYVQTFLDEGESMQHLLIEALEKNIHPEYVRRLLQSFQDKVFEGGYSHDRLTLHGKSKPVKPLTERELEVIQLIAEGCTNKEIAQTLYLSVRTVKYYATSIYTKLNVSGRAQAAVKAKELGYLN